MERHRQAVGKIAGAVRGFFERKEPFRVWHGSTNSTRPRPGAGAATVDISGLSHVVAVDGAARTALVEPNVPMDRLVEATLRQGLVPPVVMEFPGITAGGGFAGTAGESSSFRHGFFDETVRSVEMVLGNGDVVTAARDGDGDGDGDGEAAARADLFGAAAGALGTLGLTTLLELRLVEARRWVRTTYHRAGSVAEALALVRAATADPANDYVDGILFSREHGVVVTGRMTDDKPAATAPQTFSRARDAWFYLHAHDRTRALAPAASTTDYVPLAEYLFRYDRAGFWVGAEGWTYFRLVPFSPFFRWLLDDFMHTRMLYRALHASGESARFVVQDLVVPYARAADFVDYAAREFAIWPLWLCPLKRTPPPTFHPYTSEPYAGADADAESKAEPTADAESQAEPTADAESKAEPTTAAAPSTEMLNIGLWGWGPSDHDAFVAKNRGLEAKLAELGGRKWLYAHTYYSEDDFWRVYGGAPTRAWYDALRRKYHATTLPSVYDKARIDVDAARADRRGLRMSLKSTWPFGGLYGIWKSIQSGDYKLHRNAAWKYKGDS